MFNKRLISCLFILLFNLSVIASEHGVEETKGRDIVDVNIGNMKIAAERATINKLAALKSILDLSKGKKQLLITEVNLVKDFESTLRMLLHVLHDENYANFSLSYLEKILPLAEILGLDLAIKNKLIKDIDDKKRLIELQKKALRSEITKLGFGELSVLQNLFIDEIVTQYFENGRLPVELSPGEEHILPLEVLKLLSDKQYLSKEIVMEALRRQALIDSSLLVDDDLGDIDPELADANGDVY